MYIKTRKEDMVIKLDSGKIVCKYCGKEMKIDIEKTTNPHYYDDEYNMYSCDCEDWINYFKLKEELEEYDRMFYNKYLKEYRLKREKIESKYKKYVNADVDKEQKGY